MSTPFALAAGTTREPLPLTRHDAAIAAMLGLIAFAMLLLVTQHFADAIAARSLGGRWFQSDGWRVYDDMVVFSANHYRTDLRPLFSLLTIPATTVLVLFGLSPLQAIFWFNALCLAAWTSGIFLVLRLVGVPRLASLLLGAMALTSAAVLFWFIVPETYGLSSLCLVLALLLAALHVRREAGNLAFSVTGGLLAATLITNWAVAVALAFALKPRRDAVVITVASLALFIGAWAVQKAVFPAPAGFSVKKLASERIYIFHPDQGGTVCKLVGEFVAPVLAPATVPLGAAAEERSGRRVTAQCSMSRLSKPAYALATAAWLALLALGTVSMRRVPRMRPFFFFVAAALGWQVLLHLVYGEETFLYSLHFVPLLVIVAGVAFVAFRRRALLVALAALVAFSAYNNVSEMVSALTLHDSGGTDPRIVERIGLPQRVNQP